MMPFFGGLALGGLLGALTNPNDPLKGAAIGAGVGGISQAAAPALQGLLAPSGGSLAGAAPIVDQGAQAGLPSLSSELAGIAPGVSDFGQALQIEKAQQAAALLPQQAPGFTQKLTSGLLSTAPALIPKAQPQRPPASGPALSRPQAPLPDNLFMKFNRRRR